MDNEKALISDENESINKEDAFVDQNQNEENKNAAKFLLQQSTSVTSEDYDKIAGVVCTEAIKDTINAEVSKEDKLNCPNNDEEVKSSTSCTDHIENIIKETKNQDFYKKQADNDETKTLESDNKLSTEARNNLNSVDAQINKILLKPKTKEDFIPSDDNSDDYVYIALKRDNSFLKLANNNANVTKSDSIDADNDDDEEKEDEIVNVSLNNTIELIVNKIIKILIHSLINEALLILLSENSENKIKFDSFFKHFEPKKPDRKQSNGKKPVKTKKLNKNISENSIDTIDKKEIQNILHTDWINKYKVSCFQYIYFDALLKRLNF